MKYLSETPVGKKGKRHDLGWCKIVDFSVPSWRAKGSALALTFEFYCLFLLFRLEKAFPSVQTYFFLPEIGLEQTKPISEILLA